MKLKSDPFDDEKWWINFCDKWELPMPNIRIKEAMSKLRILRFILDRLFDEITTSGSISEEHLENINYHLSSMLFSYELIRGEETFQLGIRTSYEHDETFYVKVLMSAVELITEFDLKRVKSCDNPECNWYFYDNSKNKNKKMV